MLKVLRSPPLPTLALPVGLPRFPWPALAGAVAFAILWAATALNANNFEMQSIDLCHHVMFVDHLQSPWGIADAAFVGQYPLLSHRVAAALMPVYHNPLQAVRAAALASVLVMLVAQWYLLRSVFRPAQAMLLLVAWQCLCTNCKLGNINHFLWEFQYNFSRAVSAAALWVMILSFVVPPSRWKVLNALVAVGLAAFAFRCHIAAGSLALATCGTWCIVNLIRKDWLTGGVGLGGLMLTAASLLLFTDEWRYLASLSHDNGPMPIRHPVLIALWIPTSVLALLYSLWISRRGSGLTINFPVAVCCGLLPAAVLQGYMLYGKNVLGTIGSYPYNQMLFYTFSLSMLLWIAALARLFNAIPHSVKLETVLAMIAAGWGLHAMLEADVKRKSVEAERDPIQVVKQLKSYAEQFRGHYYYDPDLEHASYYVTRAVQGAGSDSAARYRLHCHLRKPHDLFREKDLQGLVLPASVDVDKLLGPACPRMKLGPFWLCELTAYRKSPEFAQFLKGGGS